MTNNIIKIADFGLSTKLKPGKFLYDNVGTNNYISPEIMKEKPYSGEMNDFWGLGIILYVLLH